MEIRSGHDDVTPTTTSRLIPRAHSVSWWMLLISTLAILITSIDRVILPTVLPAVLKDFKLTTIEGGFLNSLSFFGTFIGAFVFGVLGDSIGKGARRTWTWTGTVLIAVIGSFASAFTTSLGVFRFLRVVMGFGTGGMEPVNVALIGEWWQKENRGFAVGVHHTGFPIGQFLGPVFIGLVLAVATWRETFLWIPLIGIIIMILQIFIGRQRNLVKVNGWIREHQMTPSIDEKEVQHWRNPFIGINEVVRNRNVLMAVLTSFLLIFAEFGVSSFLTLQLTTKVGIPLAEAAIISGASGLTGWIGQVVWGTASDRLGRKFSLSIIAVGWAVTVLSCMFISSTLTAWLILLGWGIFRNSPFPVAYALLLDSVPDSASSGMGLMIGIALGLSGTISPLLAGYLIQNFGFTWEYIVMAIPCLLALIPIALIQETVRKEPPARSLDARSA